MNSTRNHPEISHHDMEIDLSRILHYLWEQKWLVLIVTSVMFALGVFFASQQIPQYQTDVLLQIQGKKQGNSMIGGISKKLDLATSGDNTAATHSVLIQSRFILEPVIKTLGLDIEVYPYQSALMGWLFSPQHKKLAIKINTFEVPRNNIAEPYLLKFDQKNHVQLYNADGDLELQGQVGLLLTNDAHSIKLHIASVNVPIYSRFTLIKQSDEEVTKTLLKRLRIKDLGGKENTDVLQLSLQGSNPKKMIQILNAIAYEARDRDTQKKSHEASKALKFLYKQLPLAKNSLDQAETELNRYRATSGKIDIKLQSQSLLAQLEELDKQLSTLKVNKIDMLQRYTMSHPFLIAQTQQITALEKKHRELESRLKKLPASDQIAVNLMRDVEVKNSLYLILLSKIQELEFIKAGTVSNVRILSGAKLPNQSLPNHHRLIYGGSILLGFALSFLIIFIRKLLSFHIDDPHWIEKHYHLINLAIIPFSKEQKLNSKKFKNHSVNHLPLLADIDPKNLSIEALRALRTSLQVTLRSAPNNIVSILGISPGGGKTFISSNLAWLLAVAGNKVLLIDGDFRRGVLHHSFNLPSKPGLVDALTHSIALKTVLKPTLHPNLTLLPRGSFVTNPSELLMSSKLKEFLDLFSKQFDIVIIDTAPILLVTDGVILAGHSGTNYLVLGSNAHHPTDLRVVMKRLSNANIPIHGSIFNCFKASSKNNYYSQHNAYYHYSDEDR